MRYKVIDRESGQTLVAYRRCDYAIHRCDTIKTEFYAMDSLEGIRIFQNWT